MYLNAGGTGFFDLSFLSGADAEGDGQIAGILPPGPMSIIDKRPFDGCLTDEFEFHVAVAYHIDGMTHGPTPGPVCTWAVQRAFMFKP